MKWVHRQCSQRWKIKFIADHFKFYSKFHGTIAGNVIQTSQCWVILLIILQQHTCTRQHNWLECVNQCVSPRLEATRFSEKCFLQRDTNTPKEAIPTGYYTVRSSSLITDNKHRKTLGMFQCPHSVRPSCRPFMKCNQATQACEWLDSKCAKCGWESSKCGHTVSASGSW